MSTIRSIVFIIVFFVIVVGVSYIVNKFVEKGMQWRIEHEWHKKSYKELDEGEKNLYEACYILLEVTWNLIIDIVILVILFNIFPVQ